MTWLLAILMFIGVLVFASAMAWGVPRYFSWSWDREERKRESERIRRKILACDERPEWRR